MELSKVMRTLAFYETLTPLTGGLGVFCAYLRIILYSQYEFHMFYYTMFLSEEPGSVTEMWRSFYLRRSLNLRQHVPVHLASALVSDIVVTDNKESNKYCFIIPSEGGIISIKFDTKHKARDSTMPNILIVEDDADINNMLRDLLKQSGYQPAQAYSGTEAVLCMEKIKPDLVLLDLMLPGKSGADVLEEIRRISDTPVIALTAVNDRDSKISMLKSGADDYITKPFDNGELLARIEALLRRTLSSQTAERKTKLCFKDLEIDMETYEVKLQNEAIILSKHEFEILKLLMGNPKRVFTKNNFYETVWGEEFIGDDNTINVYISRIRSKLERINSDEEYIQTVWGIGFKMKT